MLKATKFTQDELLLVNQKPKTSTPDMVTKFNPSNPDIKKFIHSNWNIIQHSSDCVNTFKDKPLVGFRKLSNIRNLLTRAQISYPPPNVQKSTIRSKYCTNLGKCTYCPLIIPITQVRSKITHRIYPLDKYLLI